MRMMAKMTKSSLALGLAGSLMVGAAFAQEAEGPSSVQETYRDWIVSCEMMPGAEGQPDQRACEMRQELRQAEGNQLVLAAGLQTQGEAASASLTLVAPFGLALSQPITIDIAETRLVEVPFRTCFPRGCIAVTTLDEVALDGLMAGDEAQVSMTTTAGQALVVTISLAGFTGAWTRLQDLTGG
jgi:invasion protein IalB